VRAEQGWSYSRTVFWRADESSLSLLKNRRTIMLTTNRAAHSGEQEAL
jgi:hypothetical protein